jgi:3-oxoadipate enol-lactonase
VRIRGNRLHVEDVGTGPPVLFSHGLLWSARMFAPQVAALRDRHRCVSYDHRGQGRSQFPRTPIISIETVYEDAVALIEAMDLAPCHFVGLSMGGFVGQRIAARRPELLRSLVLIDTADTPEPRKSAVKYGLLCAVARVGALRATRPAVEKAMFGDTFLHDPTRAEERARLGEELMGNRPTVVRAVLGVLTRKAVTDELAHIRTPTLVIHGEEDRAIPVKKGRTMADRIPGARFVAVPKAGHSSTLEEPAAVTEAIAKFIAEHPG